MDLAGALEATEGVTCLAGAGGKKTTMRRLAPRLDAVVTATVRIPVFDRWVERVVVTDDPVTAVRAHDERPLGVVPEREREDRYRGYDTGVVDDLAAAADEPVLVKADGARARTFKAPGDREPQVPAGADTVVPVAGVRAVGEPLDEKTVHRVERVAELTGLDPGDRIGAEHVAAVLADERGGRKGVPAGAATVPLLNMVDDDDLERTAREVARAVHQRASVPRVVLAEMRASRLVATV